MIPAAGPLGRASYKYDIKILRLQIDSTGHNCIENNCEKREEIELRARQSS